MLGRLQNVGGNGNGYFSQAATDYAARMKTKDTQNSRNMTVDEAIQRLLGEGRRAPYSLMANEQGIIEYKGVEFYCDYEHNRLCLGDVSDLRKCISIGLEKGGCLVFNRENIDELVKAIDMFSPEDINRIMRAIAQDAKLKQTQVQIEDKASGMEVLDKPEEEEKADESKRQRNSPAFKPWNENNWRRTEVWKRT